ncbi:MAG: hypothetical protein J6D47_13110 [Peptostreptococcaceae bacterium]|jgi:hypothetical protein|nr:hypothetical protein [Peptostreptococcaceae bacterium]
MTYHSNEDRLNLAFLDGSIQGQQRIIDIYEESGLYKVYPEKKIEDIAFLKGLEQARKIMEGYRLED